MTAGTFPRAFRRRMLTLGALAGAVFATQLAFGATSALAAYTAQFQGQTLQLVGDGASDKLALRLQAGSPNILQVDVGDDGTADFAFDRSSFTGIDVEAGGGNDQVRVDQTNGAFTDEAVTINGGNGNDTLLGGDGAEIFIGGKGNDFVDGNRGNDLALLGSGNDTFHWDPGDGSDTVEGQNGSDTLDFAGSNANEKIDVSANGPRVRFFRDVANIVMDLDGVEHIGFHALGGADTIVAHDLSGTDAKSVDVDLAASGGAGDGQADTVIAQGTSGPDQLDVSSAGGRVTVSGLGADVNVTGSEAANDTVEASGAGGNDTITTGIGVSGPAAIAVDGGDGVDTTQFEGTPSADSIQIVPNGTAATVLAPATAPVNSTAENLTVLGLGGPDTITGSNGLAPLTALTIDGGNGDDTLLGGDGADVMIGGNGNDFVDGNRGNDIALLGSGSDTFHWDPGDGSDIVEGQAGKDLLDFAGSNANENIDVSANGQRVRFFRDVGNIVMDLNGVEGIAFHALGGADTITANDLTGTDAKTFDVDLAATGGGGDGQADTVVVNGTDTPDNVKVTRSGSQVQVSGLALQTRITGSEPANDTLRVQTLAGNDTVSIAAGVNDLIQTIVDLGADG
jgi:Ca2+-binding RTX toxin-like protein